MKKTIFATLAAALVLASCAKVEVTEVPDSRAIGFDNFVTNAVKSIDNADALNKFYVYGGPASAYTNFNGVEVTKAATGEFGYKDVQYWEEDKIYQFAAYSDENAAAPGSVSFNETVGDNQYHLTLADYTTDGSKDLIYAYAHNAQYNSVTDGTVVFDFHHILSKIIFRFSKSETLNGSQLTISDVKILSLNNQGTFKGRTLTGSQHDYIAWSDQSGTEAAPFMFAGNDGEVGSFQLTDNDKDVDTNPELLIPQSADGSNLKVEFTVTPAGTIAEAPHNKPAKKFTVTLPAPANSYWAPGLVYVYYAVINAENFDLKPIRFGVEMNQDWTDSSDDLNSGLEFDDSGEAVIP